MFLGEDIELGTLVVHPGAFGCRPEDILDPYPEWIGSLELDPIVLPVERGTKSLLEV